jgi:hypothetical protein
MEKDNKEDISLHGTGLGIASSKPVEANNIVFHANYGAKEVLRFTEDKLFLYGEEVNIHDPKVIEGFKNWMTNNKYLCDCE